MPRALRIGLGILLGSAGLIAAVETHWGGPHIQQLMGRPEELPAIFFGAVATFLLVLVALLLVFKPEAEDEPPVETEKSAS